MSESKDKRIKVALDVMGGDFAPVNEIQGAIELFNDYKDLINKIEIVFVGQDSKIRATLNQYNLTNLKYSIINADEIITMHDEPTAAVKHKKNSSLYKGLELLKEGYVDAFVSAGNTGAVLATSTILLGRIKGVTRPTIGSFLPTEKENPTLLLDVGANVDSKSRFLYEFAIMGSIHFKNSYNVDNPRVGLLNIGEETSKGNQVVLDTYNMLKEDGKINFIGNIEGRDILKGAADVVVCDGFTGNIILKFAESFVNILKSKIRQFAMKNKFNLLLAGIIKPVLKNILKDFDYQEHGGVPLLGVDGIVIIGHGKSTPKAIKHMLKRAFEMVQKDVNKKIELALNKG